VLSSYTISEYPSVTIGLGTTTAPRLLVALPLKLLEDIAPLPAVLFVAPPVGFFNIVAPVVPAIILIIGSAVGHVVRHGWKGSRHY